MPSFKAVLVEHGYGSVTHEREMIESAGGVFIDCDKRPLSDAMKECRDADAIMVRRVTVTAGMIEQFRRCKILLRYGVGVDNIDIAAATRAGIIVGHVPVYCEDEVSTHAIALLLACVRKVVTTHEKMRAGGWDVHRTDPIFRTAGKTLGLVGLGTLGQAVARKLRHWNLRVIAHDPFVDPDVPAALDCEMVPLHDLLRQSDFVSLHVPLLPETNHLMRRETFAEMKPGAILVNTARGSVVSGPDLIEALDSGKLAAAALDVFENEPLPANDPLRLHPKIVLSDHTAWYSEDSQAELQKRAAAEVVRACTGGLPENIANPEILEHLGRTGDWSQSYMARWRARREQAGR